MLSIHLRVADSGKQQRRSGGAAFPLTAATAAAGGGSGPLDAEAGQYGLDRGEGQGAYIQPPD